jgi:hypothetical protein
VSGPADGRQHEGAATAQRFTADDGIEIGYRKWGPGEVDDAVVPQHGFAADGVTNWDAPGVVALLTATIDRCVVRLAVGGIGRGAVELGGFDRRPLPVHAR